MLKLIESLIYKVTENRFSRVYHGRVIYEESKQIEIIRNIIDYMLSNWLFLLSIKQLNICIPSEIFVEK